MTLRLARHWPVLWRHLGLNPWRSEDWKLDEALVAEVYAEDLERDATLSTRRRNRRGR